MAFYTRATDRRRVEEGVIKERKKVGRPKRICSCGDPHCAKGLSRKGRPLSGMAAVDPVVKKRRASELGPVEFDQHGEITGDISPAIRKLVEKSLRGKTVETIYNTALGLPSRVRRYVKKVWKLEDRGHDWPVIADEMTQMAVKILDHRVDVVTYAKIVQSREDKLGPEKLTKLAVAIAEADAILTLYSYYFLPGVTVGLMGQCVQLAEQGMKEYVLGGVVDVIDYGRPDPVRRRRRRQDAENDMKTYGWKMPKRDK